MLCAICLFWEKCLTYSQFKNIIGIQKTKKSVDVKVPEIENHTDGKAVIAQVNKDIKDYTNQLLEQFYEEMQLEEGYQGLSVTIISWRTWINGFLWTSLQHKYRKMATSFINFLLKINV